MVLSIKIELDISEDGSVKLPGRASLDPLRTALALDLIAESRRQNPERHQVKLSPHLSRLMSEVVSQQSND